MYDNFICKFMPIDINIPTIKFNGFSPITNKKMTSCHARMKKATPCILP